MVGTGSPVDWQIKEDVFPSFCDSSITSGLITVVTNKQNVQYTLRGTKVNVLKVDGYLY